MTEASEGLAGVPDAFQRLWTPHRMVYIGGENKPSDASEGECPFCRAARRPDADGLVVHRGALAYVVLNLYPKITLHDVFTGKAELEEAILPAPGGFSVLLAGSGMVEYSRMTPEVRDQLQKVIDQVAPRFDHVLLDTGAGISDVVLYAVSLADDVLVVAHQKELVNQLERALWRHLPLRLASLNPVHRLQRRPRSRPNKRPIGVGRHRGGP